MFLHWLCSLLIAAALVLQVLKPPFAVKIYDQVKSLVTESQLKIIAIAALAVYAVLVIAELCLIFKRRKRTERGFIVMDSSDSGRVRIAVSAIEQMVRRSVTDIEGITDMKIKIESDEDAINIGVNASLINGGHVPTVTMNMQQAIRQFVEMNCGVAVRSVSIVIRSVTEPSRKERNKKKAALAAPQTPVEEVAAEAPATEATVVEAEPAPPAYEPEPEEPAYHPAAIEPEGQDHIAYSPEPEAVEAEAPAADEAPEDDFAVETILAEEPDAEPAAEETFAAADAYTPVEPEAADDVYAPAEAEEAADAPAVETEAEEDVFQPLDLPEIEDEAAAEPADAVEESDLPAEPTEDQSENEFFEAEEPEKKVFAIEDTEDYQSVEDD